MPALQCITSENSISEGTVPFIHTFYYCLSICPPEWATYHASLFFSHNLKNYERKIQFFCVLLWQVYWILWSFGLKTYPSPQADRLLLCLLWIYEFYPYMLEVLRMGTFYINNYPGSDVLHTVAIFFHFYSILGLITHNINLGLSYLIQPVG